MRAPKLLLEINGAKRTNDEYFNMIMYNAVNCSNNMMELSNNLSVAKRRLDSSEIFSHVDITLKVPNGGSMNGNIDGVKISLDVKEKGIPSATAQTEISPSGNPQGYIEGSLRNPLGGGEIISISNKAAISGETGCHFSFQKSFQYFDLISSLKNMTANASTYSNYTKNNKSYDTEIISLDGKNRLSIGMAWQDEVPAAIKGREGELRDASSNIVYESSASTKAFIKLQSILLDTIEKKDNPSQGSLLKSNFELAIPPGSNRFISMTSSFQTHQELSENPNSHIVPGLVASFVSSMGFLLPWNNTNNTSQSSPPTSCLSERFHMGGLVPSSGVLRGFDYQGCGPRSIQRGCTVGPQSGFYGDALGANYVGSALFALSVPVPVPAVSSYLRAISFINCGIIGNASSSYQLERQTRASLGLGISGTVAGMVRVEATYALPLLRAPHDVLRPWQLGFSLTMN